jgi:hypothetical protein
LYLALSNAIIITITVTITHTHIHVLTHSLVFISHLIVVFKTKKREEIWHWYASSLRWNNLCFSSRMPS